MGRGVTCCMGIYGDLVLGRAGVYIEGSVWHKYTLMVKIRALHKLIPFPVCLVLACRMKAGETMTAGY